MRQRTRLSVNTIGEFNEIEGAPWGSLIKWGGMHVVSLRGVNSDFGLTWGVLGKTKSPLRA